MSKSILQEASEIRGGSRNADYGDAVQNFERISQMAQLMTGRTILPEDCVAVMIAVKLCREAYNHKRDNLVDLCGYADIMELIKESNTKNEGGTTND